MNPRPTRVRFARESERVQIDTSIQTADQEDMYNECYYPTSPMPDFDQSSDVANSEASLGFDHISRGPAQTLFLKMTNPDQLAITGSCFF